MIIGNIIAVMIIAAIPWALALPVLRWHPAMQTAQARHTYRLATYGIAFAFSAVSFFVPALGMVWFIPLGAAIWLDIKWLNLSRTRKGRAALAFAKEEAKPPAPLPPPPYYDSWFRPGVIRRSRYLRPARSPSIHRLDGTHTTVSGAGGTARPGPSTFCLGDRVAVQVSSLAATRTPAPQRRPTSRRLSEKPAEGGGAGVGSLGPPNGEKSRSFATYPPASLAGTDDSGVTP